MNYSKVQFISWEIDTAPYTTEIKDEKGGYVEFYPGINNYPIDIDLKTDIISQCKDIEARVAVFSLLLNKVLERLGPAKTNDVLRIFIAPEFLFRGVAGAYQQDLLNGWIEDAPEEYNLQGTNFQKAWPGLFGRINEVIQNEKFENWLFVMGSSIGASYNVEEDATIINFDAEAYNCSFIQLGGLKGNVLKNRFVAIKSFKSVIDFLKRPYFDAISDEKVKYLEKIDSPQNTDAIFTLEDVKDTTGENIKFGIEICLDHAFNGTQNVGRIRSMNQRVKIQLVPSCGMNLISTSIALEDGNSYAINCDGYNGYRHTNGLKRNGDAFDKITFSEIEEFGIPNAPVGVTTLWKSGIGNIKYTDELPL